MGSIAKRTAANRRYLMISAPFLIGAHLIALVGGFGTGVLMAGGAAGWWALGPWWAAVVQAHAVLQTMGWGALWVIGVGAVLIPKLAGVSLARPSMLPWSAGLLCAGLGLRAASQGLGAAVALLPWPAALTLGASGILMAAGVLLAALTLGLSLRGVADLRGRPRLWKILPFIVPAFGCLLLAALVQAALSVHAAWNAAPLLFPPLHRAAGHLLLAGFLVPAAMGVGALLLPPFFRWGLIPSRPLRVVALILFAATIVEAAALGAEATAILRLSGATYGGAILVYLGLFLQAMRHPPPSLWPPNRAPVVRRWAFDRGEHGRFELLVWSAFAWLGIAAVVQVAGGASDASRHALGVGFVTLLIAAMALRLVPGLLGGRVAWRGIAWPLFGAGNLAVAGRVLPILIPGLPAGPLLFGLSSVAGMAVVVLLAIHLFCALAPNPTPAAQVLRARGG